MGSGKKGHGGGVGDGHTGKGERDGESRTEGVEGVGVQDERLQRCRAACRGAR